MAMVVMAAEEAMRAMQAGKVPPRLRVEGDLRFYQQAKVEPPRALPSELLVAESVVLHDASRLTQWPRVVRCHKLYLWRFQFDFSPDALLEIEAPTDAPARDGGQLHLGDCLHFTRLPQLASGSLRELRLHTCPLLAELPTGLRVDRLTLRDCPALVSLPADLAVAELDVGDCPRLARLPDALQATSVSLPGCTGLEALPDDCAVGETLDISGCINLTRLPETVEAVRLNIAGCRGLTELPRRLRSLYIDMSGCAGLTRWDDPEVTELRQVSVRGCANLASLPPNLRQVDELDLAGCERLTFLPPELRVTRWVDVADSGLRALPAAARGAQLHWNGVNVPGQVAFHPETLTVRQVLGEENAELRRIMLERIGPERFVAEARPQLLDADRDAGGVRRLLRVAIADDEPLVALEVRDPSTGRTYLLRVPPEMDTCRRAAAWIAGFDNPEDYAPVMET